MTQPQYVWTEIRDRAIREFGLAPPDDVESRLVSRFQREPKLIQSAIEVVILGVQDKTIRNPWALVDLNTKNAIAKLGATDETTRRSKAIERAERWAKSIGWQFPYSAYEDELFGRRGKLTRYRGDSALRQHMQELWTERQPAEEPTPAPTSGATA